MKKIILLILFITVSLKMSAIEIENISVSTISNQEINIRLNTMDLYTYSYNSYQYNITNNSITLDVCYIPGAGAAISYLENNFQIPLDNTIVANYSLIVRVYYINLTSFICDYQTISDTENLLFSTPLSGTVSLSTSTIINESNISILYPNPTNGILIYNEHIRIENIDIYDSLGKLTNKIKKFENKLDLHNLEDGIYFIKIQIKNKIFTEKILLRK